MTVTDSLLLTVDELHALCRVAELSLPRFVTAADSGEVAVDAAALRGLAARGLLELTGDEALDAVRVTDRLTRLLAPCSAARLLAEIEIESGGRLARLAITTKADRPVTLLTGLDAGLVEIECVNADVENVLTRLCRVDEVADSAAGEAFVVDAEAQADADAMAVEGDDEAAVDTLAAAGLPRRVARAWVAAVVGRRLAVFVRVARRFTGSFEAAELRWLVAGDGTAWRVEPEDGAAVITPVGRQTLGEDLTDLAGRTGKVANR
jgi:hypothetical protein